MSQASPYWQAVHAMRDQIPSMIAQQNLQPKLSEGVVWIVSLGPRAGADPAIRAGILSLCTHAIAAQRMCDQSHVLATDDQITKYLAEE
jgi:hypothetical protein